MVYLPSFFPAVKAGWEELSERSVRNRYVQGILSLSNVNFGSSKLAAVFFLASDYIFFKTREFYKGDTVKINVNNEIAPNGHRRTVSIRSQKLRYERELLGSPLLPTTGISE